MTLNKHLEAQIKDRLDNLETGPDPGSWDLMAQRLDFEAQQELDLALENRLARLAVPMPTGSWDALEKMIEADEAAEMIENEARIDNIAHEKLSNLTVPYQNLHWELMAKRIEEEFSLRHKLYRYKVAELALISLLLLTIIRFAPLLGYQQESGQASIFQHQQPNKPNPNVEAGTLHKIAPLQQHDAGFAPITSWKPNTFSSSSSVPVLGNLTGRQSVIQAEKQVQINESTADQPPTGTGRAADNIPALSYLPIAKHLISNTMGKTGISPEMEILSTTPQRVSLDMDKSRMPDALALLPIEAPTDTEFGWELPLVKTLPGKKAGQLRFGVFMATDFNYVTTPANQITVFGEPVNTKRNETMASGYGGGLNVSWKKQRWEYQTGGIYSFKRYLPNTPIFIFDTPNFFIKEDFNGIQLDILQVPLNVLYHFKNTGKWHFYTSVGASAHFVTATLYEIDHTSKALRSTPIVNSSADDKRSITNDEEGSLEFPSGLLDGGKLHGNHYFSANLGLGVERYLSPKWTVFFQPNYQHFLLSGGIGDNKDKIYTTSFYLGTKFNLK